MRFNDYKRKVLQEDKEFRTKYLSTDFDFETCNLLTIARLHANLTQKELAERMKTKQPSIARTEAGYLPTLPFLKRAATAIGTTLIPPKFAFMDKIYNKDESYNDIYFSNESTVPTAFVMSTDSIHTHSGYITTEETPSISAFAFSGQQEIPRQGFEKGILSIINKKEEEYV